MLSWGLLGVLLCAVVLGASQIFAQTTNAPLLAITRHALQNNGRIEGSAQQLLGEDINLNSGSVTLGDLLVPGTPSTQFNGTPTSNGAAWSGVQAGSGSTSPSGYRITVNSGVQLRSLKTRTNPVTLNPVTVPPNPAGTRQLNIDSPAQAAAVGNFATVRDLNLNSGAGNVPVPPGTYGVFNASNSNNTGFTFGTTGSSAPVVYNLQSLTLNSNSRITLLSPVVLNVRGQVAVNSNTAIIGSSTQQNCSRSTSRAPVSP